MPELPPLGVTMGDASGISPEIVAKALTSCEQRAVVFGSHLVMADTVRRLGITADVRQIASPEEALFAPGSIEVIDVTRIIELPPLGVVSPISGQASFDAILAAIGAARAHLISGIVTAPINKAAMNAAGIRYPGHTEILADHGGAQRVAMMLANDEIRTVLVTVHASLRNAIEIGRAHV